MAEPIVDETVTPTVEQPATEVPDYEAEFQAAVKDLEQAEHNRTGYELRKGKTEEAPVVKQEDIDAMVASAVEKVLPKLQTTLSQDTVETLLSEFAGGNDAKKKLIRFHFENSVGQHGTLRERIENATLIADKKTIQKTQQELTVALNNRQGLGASGSGTSTEGQEVKDGFFSKEQLNALKAKGWDDAKIQKLRDNMMRQR